MNLNVKFTEVSTDINVKFGEVYTLSRSSEDVNTYILITPDGDEIPAVLVDEVTAFDATANDIRLGKTAVTDSGVTIGEKEIPSYQTNQGVKVIMPNSMLSLPHLIDNDTYDYTKLQTIICVFNTSLSNSVYAEMVSIDDFVYSVRSIDAISEIHKDHDNKSIEFGVTNTSDKPYIIRYFTYKEVE